MKPTSLDQSNVGNDSGSSVGNMTRTMQPYPDVEIEQSSGNGISNDMSYLSVTEGTSVSAFASPSAHYDLQTPPHHKARRPAGIPSAPPTPLEVGYDVEDVVVQPRDIVLCKDPQDACLDGMLQEKQNLREETNIAVQRTQESAAVARRRRVEEAVSPQRQKEQNEVLLTPAESVRMLDETPRLVARAQSIGRAPSPLRTSYAASPVGSRMGSRVSSPALSRRNSRATSPVRSSSPFQVYRSNTQTVQHTMPFKGGSGGGGGGGGSAHVSSSSTPQRSKPVLNQKAWNSSGISVDLGVSNTYTSRKSRQDKVDPASPSQKYGHHSTVVQSDNPWETQELASFTCQRPSDVSKTNPLVSSSLADSINNPQPRPAAVPTDLITHQKTQRVDRNRMTEARQARDRNLAMGEEGIVRVRQQIKDDPLNPVLLEGLRDEVHGHSGSQIQRKAHTLPAAGASSGSDPHNGLVYGSGTGEDAIQWDPRVKALRQHSLQFRDIRPGEQNFTGVDYSQVRAPLPHGAVSRQGTTRSNTGNIQVSNPLALKQRMSSSDGVAGALRYE